MSSRIFTQRRQKLLDQLPDRALVILPAAREVIRSRDTEYPFRQASDFWYLTGCQEPEALLVMQKGRSQGESLLFVLPKDPAIEVWTGIRLGPEGAVEKLAMDQALDLNQADACLVDLLGEASEVWLPIDDADLYQRYLGWRQAVVKQRKRSACLPDKHIDLAAYLAEQRLIKSAAEIDLLTQAASISAAGHLRALRACRPGMKEYQLQAELEHEFAVQGAAAPAYSSIVGGGANACILHYIANQDELKAGDLVLIDAGAEYQGYAGDITRTFPVNGRFTPAQKQLYEVVLRANEAAIEQVQPGVSLESLHLTAVKQLVEGLVDLGILQGEVDRLVEDEAYKPFYMHGTGHWLGLDVHDVGRYRLEGEARPLQAGMVFTIEPGLYFAPDNLAIDECWRGIGIRIEDDVLVTEQGCEVLSHAVPKRISDLEALMNEGRCA